MLLNWASRSFTAAERIFEVLDSEPEVQEPTADDGGHAAHRGQGGIPRCAFRL